MSPKDFFWTFGTASAAISNGRALKIPEISYLLFSLSLPSRPFRYFCAREFERNVFFFLARFYRETTSRPGGVLIWIIAPSPPPRLNSERGSERAVNNFISLCGVINAPRSDVSGKAKCLPKIGISHCFTTIQASFQTSFFLYYRFLYFFRGAN